MTWTDPRPDLLIGNFLCVNEDDSRRLLASYNGDEL